MAGLQQRGLGGSTIIGSFANANTRERNAAFGRLNDRLIQQRLGVDQSVSGAQLAAQQNLGLNRIGALTGQNQFGTNLLSDLGSQALSAQERASLNAFAAQQGISADQFNTMMMGQNRSIGAALSIGSQQGQFMSGLPGEFANLQSNLTADQMNFLMSKLKMPQPPQFNAFEAFRRANNT